MGLMLPKFIEKGWSYKDENNNICIKKEAPEWAKKEYEEFLEMINPKPDEDGVIKEY